MEMRRLAPLGDLVNRIAALEAALRTGKAPASGSVPPSAPATGSGKSPARAASAGSGMSAGAVASETTSGARPTIDRANEEPPVSTSDPISAEAQTSAVASGSTLDQIKSALEKKKRRLLIAALEAASRAELVGDEFSIEFTPEAKHYRDTLARADNARNLREACAEVCGREIGIRFSISDGQSGEDKPVSTEDKGRRSKQEARQAAAQNPTVQQVLRAFGGEIVDVKVQ
jgi:hypothetical protein